MTHKTKSRLIVICLLLLIALGFTGLKLLHDRQVALRQPSMATRKINSVNYNPPTTAQKNAGDQIKQQSAQQNSTPTPTGSPTTAQKNTITIARLNQSAPGQLVSLRTVLDNAHGDQCTAIFSLSGQPSITKTALIANGPTYYSCEPIDVSADEFSTNGNWQVKVYVSLSGLTISNIATGSLMVQK